MEIVILPPHVNSSGINFEVEGEGIRFGLSAIKNVGEANIMQMIEERSQNGSFTSLVDFLSRVDVNKKLLENLTYSGALDSFIINRATVIHNLDKIIAFSSQKKKDRNSGMAGLFDLAEETREAANEIYMESVPEFKENDLLAKEKENLGLYVTGHPLSKFAEKITAYSTHSSLELQEIKSLMDAEDDAGVDVPERVEVAGILTGIELKRTQKNEPMAICTLEDLEGEIKVIFFPRAYQQVQDLIQTEEPILVRGKADFERKELQILGDQAELLKTLPDKIKTRMVHLKLQEEKVGEESLNALKQSLKGFPGNDPVLFHLYDLERQKKVVIRAGKSYCVNASDALMENLRQLSCVDDVWLNGH